MPVTSGATDSWHDYIGHKGPGTSAYDMYYDRSFSNKGTGLDGYCGIENNVN